MDGVLSQFAVQTRQPQLSGATRAVLAQKWLALQLGGGVHALYAQVGNDYALVQRRHQQKPVAFSNAAFVEMMAEGFKGLAPVQTLENAHELQSFCDALFPTPADEEVWVKYHETDKNWRQLAYFLACQLPAVHSDLVGAIYAYPEQSVSKLTRAQRDEASELYTRINAYHTAHGMASPQAVGALLKQLDMTHLECHAPEDDEEDHDQEDQEELQGGPSDAEAMEEYVFTQAELVPPPLDERTASMHAYAKQALVNATFDNTRLAKQLLLLQLGAPINALAGRNQLVLTSLETPPLESEALEALIAPLSDLPALNKKSEAVRAIFALCEAPVTPYAFMRKALELYGSTTKTEEEQPELWKRQFLKRFPQVDASIVDCIRDL